MYLVIMNDPNFEEIKQVILTHTWKTVQRFLQWQQ